VALALLRGADREPDLGRARGELAEYERGSFPIFVAAETAEAAGGRDHARVGLLGYLVCRVQDDVVWAESLFVRPEHRRRGIASALYAEAERLALELGGETAYNWVHPTNDAIIAFLRKRGYEVLNLIELRRRRRSESTTRRIRVGDHEFDY